MVGTFFCEKCKIELEEDNSQIEIESQKKKKEMFSELE